MIRQAFTNGSLGKLQEKKVAEKCTERLTVMSGKGRIK